MAAQIQLQAAATVINNQVADAFTGNEDIPPEATTESYSESIRIA
jgi:hypothetical protein